MNPETRLHQRIMLALSEAGCVVWRNETAGAYMGKVIHKAGDQVTLAGARFLPAGLCKGSADIIGLTSKGRFLAVEVKTPNGRVSKDQALFLQAVNQRGGLAGVARSVADALALAELG